MTNAFWKGADSDYTCSFIRLWPRCTPRINSWVPDFSHAIWTHTCHTWALAKVKFDYEILNIFPNFISSNKVSLYLTKEIKKMFCYYNSDAGDHTSKRCSSKCIQHLSLFSFFNQLDVKPEILWQIAFHWLVIFALLLNQFRYMYL